MSKYTNMTGRQRDVRPTLKRFFMQNIIKRAINAGLQHRDAELIAELAVENFFAGKLSKASNVMDFADQKIKERLRILR